MKSKFIKTSKTPYKKYDVEKYSYMNNEEFFKVTLPQIARGHTEKWESFKEREREAVDKLTEFVFGNLYDESFDFKKIPKEYDDYQYAKHSEFGNFNSTLSAGISITIDKNEIYNALTDEYPDFSKSVKSEKTKSRYTYSVNKINTNRIGEPFDFWKTKQYLLNNAINYINFNCDNNDYISVSRWITATGKSGRTKEIELLNEGCSLSWITNDQGYLSILSPNGKIIGEINWKTDEDHYSDTEYNEIFEPFLKNKQIEIESIKIKTLIPHNTPFGRPRKALVQVLITFHKVYLEENMDLISQFKQDFKSMRMLAAIDYNRKCDIIEGKIPDVILSLEELFSDSGFPIDNPLATYDIFSSKNFLSGSSFTSVELEEIWNIYMPIRTFTSLKSHETPLFQGGVKCLFCKRKFFNYALMREEREIYTGNELVPREFLILCLFRK